jgi:hypothetical protein
VRLPELESCNQLGFANAPVHPDTIVTIDGLETLNDVDVCDIVAGAMLRKVGIDLFSLR